MHNGDSSIHPIRHSAVACHPRHRDWICLRGADSDSVPVDVSRPVWFHTRDRRSVGHGMVLHSVAYGFSVFVIGYALLKDAKPEGVLPAGYVGCDCRLGVSVWRLALSLPRYALNVLASRSLPADVLRDARLQPRLYPYYVGGPVLAMSSLAIMVLWFRRTRSLICG